MNSQKHAVTKRAPYEIVFGQLMRSTPILFYDRANTSIIDEDSQQMSKSKIGIYCLTFISDR